MHTDNGFKYSKWLNSFIWPIVGTLTSTTSPGQSGPKNNGLREWRGKVWKKDIMDNLCKEKSKEKKKGISYGSS